MNSLRQGGPPSQTGKTATPQVHCYCRPCHSHVTFREIQAAHVLVVNCMVSYLNIFINKSLNQSFFDEPCGTLYLPVQCTEVRFASFLSSGFTTMAAINLPDWKLANRTSVQCSLRNIVFRQHQQLNIKPIWVTIRCIQSEPQIDFQIFGGSIVIYSPCNLSSCFPF